VEGNLSMKLWLGLLLTATLTSLAAAGTYLLNKRRQLERRQLERRVAHSTDQSRYYTGRPHSFQPHR
jgi:hypothetical protein